jgi:heterodisulfide reductase subunit B
MTLCQCCYGTLKKANFLLRENASLRKEVNAVLEREGLPYEGEVEVKDLLYVLHQEVGVEAIKKKIAKTFKGLKIAAHYGCHALRPSQVVRFDDPVTPSIFDQLVEATGAESIAWPMRLECCGAPLWGIHDELSTEITLKKLKNGRESGADYLCTACTYCQIQFDTVQQMILSQRGLNHPLPSILYPQLLGLSMGINSETLGLKMNKIPISEVEQLQTEQIEIPA